MRIWWAHVYRFCAALSRSSWHSKHFPPNNICIYIFNIFVVFARNLILPKQIYSHIKCLSKSFWGYSWCNYAKFGSSIPSGWLGNLRKCENAVCPLNVIPLMENVISCLISDATLVDLLCTWSWQSFRSRALFNQVTHFTLITASCLTNLYLLI